MAAILVEKPMFRARLYAVSGFVTYCKHEHPSRDEAEACARTEAAKYPSGAFEWHVIEGE